MKLFTQAGWLAMQAAIFGGWMWLWVSDTSGDRPALGLMIAAGVFLAYTFTFCTLMLVEFVALGRRKAGEWRQRRKRVEYMPPERKLHR